MRTYTVTAVVRDNAKLRLPALLQVCALLLFGRRLRDKLIEEERWSLAMEVSTKCGMDGLAVWISYGKACLRVGDYETARQKFAKCFKVRGMGFGCGG